MDLDRYSIERTDFAISRRGYDPDEVDRHLREISQLIADLERDRQPRSTPVAGAAVEQVQAIVEAAERSAAEIVDNAQREADQLSEDTTRHATDARERSQAEAAAHVEAVEEATAKMLQRADRLETEADRIVDTLRSAAGFMVENIRGASGSLVEDLRGGASTLRGELEAVRSGLADVREARPRAVARAERDFPPEDRQPAGRVDPARPARGVFGTNGDEDPRDEGQTELEPARASTEIAGAPMEDENARVIALNMAMDGRPRDETARYLSENFELDDQESLLDDVYARAGSR